MRQNYNVLQSVRSLCTREHIDAIQAITQITVILSYPVYTRTNTYLPPRDRDSKLLNYITAKLFKRLRSIYTTITIHTEWTDPH